MATMTIGGLRPATPTKTASHLGPLGRLAAGLSAWRAERALESLDDHMLQDLGVSRAGISDAVRSGRRS